MGLDVYLKKITDPTLIGKAKEYSKMEQDGRISGDTLNKFALENGLDEYGDVPGDDISIDSKLYPTHMFKIGYFRSSYNDSGYDHVMELNGLRRLKDLFVFDNNDYYATVDWEASLEKINDAIEAQEEFAKSDEAKYTAMYVHCGGLSANLQPNTNAALRLFYEEQRKERAFNAYESKDGFFTIKPVPVCAVIPTAGILGSAGVTLIYESDQEVFKWYLQATEIVKETVEYVLSQPYPNLYYFIWSS